MKEITGLPGKRTPKFMTALILAAAFGLSPAAAAAQDRSFEKLLETFRAGESYERHSAAMELGKSGNGAAVEPLIQGLRDPDYLLRSFSALALGDLKDARALEPLLGALGDEHQRVRRSAIEALGLLGNPAALDPLVKCLEDPDVLVRRSAASSLGMLGRPEAVAPLLKMLGEEDIYLWNGAANALTGIGGAAVPQLVAALPDWVRGPRVAEILKTLGWEASSAEEKVRYDVAARDKGALAANWDSVRKVLIADAESGDAARAENAVYALIGIGRDETVDTLAGILRTRGTAAMAQAFLNSGNARLSETARAWAAQGKIELAPGGPTPAVAWGSLQMATNSTK